MVNIFLKTRKMKGNLVKKKIDLLIEFFYLSIVFLIPLYFGFVLLSANPFEFQKMLLFKVLLLLLLFLSSLKFIFQPQFCFSFFKIFGKYFIIPSVVVLFYLLTVMWSIDPRLSFYGSLGRQMGFVGEFYFFLFFVIVFLDLIFSENKERKINRIILTGVISSFVVSVYAIFQFFGYDFLTWEEPASITKRAMSTLGQPNFLGAFLLLTIPLSLYLFNESKRVIFKIVYFLIFVLQFLAMVFSGSRGAWLGLMIASALFLFIFYYRKNKKVFFLGLGALILFLLFLIFGSSVPSERFRSAFNVSRGSSSVRVSVWSASLDFIKENKMGIGLEGQKDAIGPYYQKDWAVLSKVNVVFDRAHNLFLDLIIEVGVIGAIIWLFFYYFVFKISFQNILKGQNRSLSVAIVWALMAYLISLLFNFSVIVTHLYFWLFVSVIFANNHSPDLKSLSRDDRCGENLVARRILVFIALILCFGGIWRQAVNFNIDYYFLKTRQFFSQKEIPAASLSFSYLRRGAPSNHEYYYSFISLVFDDFIKFKDISSQSIALEEIENIFKILEKDHKNKSFAYSMAMAQSFALLGNYDRAGEIFRDLELSYYKYPNFYFKKAKMELLRSDFSLAEVYLQKTLNLLPEDDEVVSEINSRALMSYRNLVIGDLNYINNINKYD